MTYKQFLRALKEIRNEFKWTLIKEFSDGRWVWLIRTGTGCHCPITALCESRTGVMWWRLAGSVGEAARVLELPLRVQSRIVSGADDRSRRKTRRHLLQTLGLKEHSLDVT